MLEQYLVEIGLSDKEAKVYLVLLTVDNSPISDIAKRAKINRTTVYPVLKSLEKKGLTSEVQVGKTIHYQAAPPERLQQVIGKQRLLLEERAERLKDIIPQIRGVQRETGERPLVRVFIGRDAALDSNKEFFDVEDKDGTGYFIFNKDLLFKHFSKRDLDAIAQIRPKKMIKGQSLYNASEIIPSNTMTERIRIDGGTYPIDCDISIYEDRIQFITLGKEVASIFIKSKEIAETLRSIFRLGFDSISKGE